ncbi:MAG: RHS repeat-associated core domain-containing protein [Agriterribacter sp.]
MLVIAVFAVNHLQAQQNNITCTKVLDGVAGQLVADSSREVIDTVYMSKSSFPAYDSVSITNFITLYIDEQSTRMPPDSFKLDVDVRIYFLNRDSVYDSIASKVLTIEYNNARAYNSKAVFYFKDAHQVKMKVLSVTGSYTALANILPLVKLQNDMVIKRVFSLDCSAMGVKTIGLSDGFMNSKGELVASWSHLTGAMEYDLEWTFIDQTALDAGWYNTGGVTDPEKIFRNNATRVTLPGLTYNIPMLYEGDGKLFARVRAAQTDKTGERKTTGWSSDYIADGGLGQYVFTGHERKLNWQASTSFAEDGKRKSVVQYFDGALKSRQTVTKDNITDSTLTAETFYDKQGRGVIQVLPSPTLSSIIQYTPMFNRAPGGLEYDKEKYDSLSSLYCSGSAVKMDSAYGTARYYSYNNPNKLNGNSQFLPQAKGYPFTEVKYTQDNTGRISAQGGVGQTFQLNSGHETKYYYGTPEQSDIDALFGTEAGYASHYQKNVVRDANGQYSVSYVDMHGRTVATALAGEPPAGMQQLSSYSSTTRTDSLINSKNNLVKDNSIVSVKSLLVTKTGTHNFSYALAADSLRLPDKNGDPVCYSCLYDLTIIITDDCNNQSTALGGKPYIVSDSNMRTTPPVYDTTCTGTVKDFNISFSLSLNEGNYTITKVLTLREDARDWYRDSLYAPHNTVKTKQDIMNDQLELLRAQREASCEQEAEPWYPYQQYREQMLLDLTPLIGQYAQYNKPGEPYLLPSVFQNDDGGIPVYQELTGKQMPADQFIMNFQPEWAEQLLPFHPEYSKLAYYENLKASYHWDADFEATDTYAQAFAKGYLNPTNYGSSPASAFGNGNDSVLYNIPPGLEKGTLETSMLNYTKDKDNNTISLWAMASIAGHCDPNNETCVSTFRTTPSALFGASMCQGEKDMAWRFFRNEYLRLKRDWITAFVNSKTNIIPPGSPAFPTGTTQQLQSQGNLLGNDRAAAEQAAADSMRISADRNCREYSKRWWEQLASCNYTTADSLKLVPRLVEICKKGTNLEHPFGATGISPDSVYTFRSFDELITHYNDSTGRPNDAACNAFLIDAPGPYNKPMALVDMPTYSRPDSCTCDKITALYAQYQNSAGYNNFSEYIQQKLHTTITQNALDSLRNLCDGTIACRFIPNMIMIPPALQCSTGYDVCVDCNEVNTVYTQFKSSYPGIIPGYADTTTLQRQYNELFKKYMNNKLGFDKTALEYLVFMDSCSSWQLNLPDTLIIPSTGIEKPAGLNCEDLIKTYNNFLTDFPHPENGANVRIFVEGESGESLSLSETQSLQNQLQANSEENLSLPDTALSNKSGVLYLNEMQPMVYTPEGYWTDTFLVCKPLFEWYFSAHLNLSGYNYNVYMDWLANYCGVKVRQMPCGNQVAARYDTLQNILTRFNAKYGALGDTITETMSIPPHKILHITQTQTLVYSTHYSSYALATVTWTNGGLWYNDRDNVAFNLPLIPLNATINSANLNLYAKPEKYEMYTAEGAHFRYKTDTVYGVFDRYQNIVVPGQTTWPHLPPVDSTHRLSLAPISVDNGNGGVDHIYSDENYLNQPCTNLVADMYTEARTNNRNFGLQFRLTKEVFGTYKAVIFWGNTSNTPSGKKPYLSVNYTASKCDVFAGFVNDALHTHMTCEQVMYLYGLCNINTGLCTQVTPGGLQGSLLLCGKNEPSSQAYTIDDVYDPPCSDSTILAYNFATERYTVYKDSLDQGFNKKYNEKCLAAASIESFTVNHPVSEYHYTLYYYDQAGNLVKTVAPAGVQAVYRQTWMDSVMQFRNAGERLAPPHSMPTVYRYNSLNQVVSQKTPDAGKSANWYDRLGRLAVSQNAAQLLKNKYSYTLYDALSRIVEVGQKYQTTAMTQTISRNPASLAGWVYYNNGSNHYPAEMVTQTIYDIAGPDADACIASLRFTQKSYTLRNRVSYTRYYEKPSYYYSSADARYYISPATYTTGIDYSYDIHGNVDTMRNLYGTAAYNPMTYHGYNSCKTIAYSYDLISGKVNEVHYNPGQADEFYHRYEYDAENRLTGVFTTDVKAFIRVGGLEERDAMYSYYQHGPLARTMLGQQVVQGIDYAYTLQGWLKGINSSNVRAAFDMGRDGYGANIYNGGDAYSYTLDYYNGDFQPISYSGAQPFANPAGYLPAGEHRPLYNGNISSMTHNIPARFITQLYNYQYDQLNRLVGMDMYRGLNQTTNQWSSMVTSNLYKERYSYDGNGNIKTLFRNGNLSANPLMDSLTYFYKAGTNQLDYIRDRNAGSTAHSANYGAGVDIKDQQAGNYNYDGTGNMVYDRISGIDSITWNVYGKIQHLSKQVITGVAHAKEIHYYYDPSGSRVGKAAIFNPASYNSYSWYVKDAQGNVLAVYETTGSNISTSSLKLTEHHIYGSSRLGIISRSQDVDGARNNVSETEESNLDKGYLYTFTKGSKFFELSNHLGNVLVTISDVKVPAALAGNASVVGSYSVQMVVATDYMPFGMVMPGRNYNSAAGTKYRYGFNGKEYDNEVKGTVNQIDYGERAYGPREGRFWSVDPLTSQYPFLTPYQYASNRPIDGIDLDGMELLKTIPQFEKSGGAFDYVTEIDNAVIRLINLPMTTWNSAVANYQSAKRGTWKQDIKAEAKQMGEGMKATAKQFYHAPITTLTSPEAIGFYTEAYIGGKIFSISPQSNSLVKITTSGGTPSIALGLNEPVALGPPRSLARFADQTLSFDHTQWKKVFGNVATETNSGGFGSIFTNVMDYIVKNKGVAKFDLTNFKMERAIGDIGKSAPEASSLTNFEFNTIMGNKKYLDATKFYKNGELIPTEKIVKEYSDLQKKK